MKNRVPVEPSLVLVADDEGAICQIVARVVAQLGLATIIVGDGAAAISQASEHQADLRCAIIDVRMPILDGISAAQAIRAESPDLAIVLMSASFPDHYHQQCADLGIDYILHKPFSIAELQGVLSNAARIA